MVQGKTHAVPMEAKMLEGELEEALCRSYRLLLPDLAAAGFKIEGQQAVLLGRRLDMVLRGSTGQACIIELKRGLPPMPDVRDQVLDYAQCWKASFPAEVPPRLLVIGTFMNDRVRDELANFGVEARSISEAAVLAALTTGSRDSSVVKGLHLQPTDTAKVRHLLSDFDVVRMPSELLLRAPWTHEKVFLALVKRGERHKDLWKKNIYVELYPQKPNCALLYGPKAKPYARAPLHLNPRRKAAWREGVFAVMEPAIRFVQSDNKGVDKAASNFDHYDVTDWNEVAAALKL